MAGMRMGLDSAVRSRFEPEHDWRATVRRYVPDAEFELEMVRADDNWLRKRVGVRLEPRAGRTWVRFHHIGWPSIDLRERSLSRPVTYRRSAPRWL